MAKNITMVGGGSALGFGWKSLKSCPGGRFSNQWCKLYLSRYICKPPTTVGYDPSGGMNLGMRCVDLVMLPGDGIAQTEIPDFSSWSDFETCPVGYAICGLK